jgi:hypothetical protein
MRTYDFAPLWRSTVGFDRLFDLNHTSRVCPTRASKPKKVIPGTPAITVSSLFSLARCYDATTRCLHERKARAMSIRRNGDLGMCRFTKARGERVFIW